MRMVSYMASLALHAALREAEGDGIDPRSRDAMQDDDDWDDDEEDDEEDEDEEDDDEEDEDEDWDDSDA